MRLLNLFGGSSGENFLANARHRQGEVESASVAGLGFDPDDSGVKLDNLLDNRKANAGAVDSVL